MLNKYTGKKNYYAYILLIMICAILTMDSVAGAGANAFSASWSTQTK